MGMTKTHDEIKKGLECRIRSYRDTCDHQCDTCDLRIPAYSIYERYEDALALIQQLQAQNAEQAERIHRFEAERDAAVADLKYVAVCETCKEFRRSALTEPCLHCKKYGLIDSENKYEWRGVQKEE